MKNLNKNQLYLAVIVAVLVLAYLGVLTIFGFAQHWGWLRMVLFFFLTFALTLTPLAVIMNVYGQQQEAREKYFQEMKAKRQE